MERVGDEKSTLGPPSPGIQIVTHTMLLQTKKFKFPSTAAIPCKVACDLMRKTCRHNSKPISATNAAFIHTLGLLVC